MLYSSQLKSKEMKSFSEFWKSILFFLTFAAMSLVQVKRKCQARPLKQKYEALQEVAKGAPKSTVHMHKKQRQSNPILQRMR